MSSRATNASVKVEAAAAVLQALHSGHGLSPRESFVSVAVWNKKGGVGKSTHATLLAAALANAGLRVGIIDGDPQLNQSVQWADDDVCGGDTDGDSDALPLSSSNSDDDEEEEEEDIVMVPSSGGGYLMPPVAGDALDPRIDSLHPDTMRDAFATLAQRDNLYDALTKLSAGFDPNFVPELMSCNQEDYEGRLLLLPSCAELYRYNDELVASAASTNAMMAGRVYGAFGKLMKALAAKYDLDFVIVDLGPHTDTLHKVIITSCDFIQLVVDASMASWASTYALLTETLPTWIRWHSEFKPRLFPGDDEAGYAFNPRFPRLLPVLGLRHALQGNSKVQWNPSNIYFSIKKTLTYKEVPKEVQELYQPCWHKQQGPTMLIPFLPTVTHLAVAQETGRAFFDLTPQNMRDYFHHNLKELNMRALTKERDFVKKRYASLAGSLRQLREHFLEERWRARCAQQAQQASDREHRKADKEQRKAAKAEREQRRLEKEQKKQAKRKRQQLQGAEGQSGSQPRHQ